MTSPECRPGTRPASRPTENRPRGQEGQYFAGKRRFGADRYPGEEEGHETIGVDRQFCYGRLETAQVEGTKFVFTRSPPASGGFFETPENGLGRFATCRPGRSRRWDWRTRCVAKAGTNMGKRLQGDKTTSCAPTIPLHPGYQIELGGILPHRTDDLLRGPAILRLSAPA